jgi:DnaK suppressor protein
MAAAETQSRSQLQLNETDVKLLGKIDRALMRIRQEGFGISEECLQSINRARLDALPWTRLCRDCQEQQDSGT